MKKFALACYERWKKLPPWLAMGLLFVIINLVGWVYLFITQMLSPFRDALTAFMVLTVLNPFIILGELFPEEKMLFIEGQDTGLFAMILQGTVSYFITGAIVGLLSQKSSLHK